MTNEKKTKMIELKGFEIPETEFHRWILKQIESETKDFANFLLSCNEKTRGRLKAAPDTLCLDRTHRTVLDCARRAEIAAHALHQLADLAQSYAATARQSTSGTLEHTK